MQDTRENGKAPEVNTEPRKEIAKKRLLGGGHRDLWGSVRTCTGAELSRTRDMRDAFPKLIRQHTADTSLAQRAHT